MRHKEIVEILEGRQSGALPLTRSTRLSADEDALIERAVARLQREFPIVNFSKSLFIAVASIAAAAYVEQVKRGGQDKRVKQAKRAKRKEA